MTLNVNGASGGRALPRSPGAPAPPADLSRAVVTAPAPASAPSGAAVADAPPPGGSPLGRSGLSALDVLLTSDVVLPRGPVAPAALEMGLEVARGAVLRQLPADALEALDAVWPQAARSEEGWYLRAGALLLQGQHHESELVMQNALAQRPRSVALGFLASVLRVRQGDTPGARAALAAAAAAAPDHPAIVAQQAIVHGRLGHSHDAGEQLRALVTRWPDHPATGWAQGELRTLRADRARAERRPDPTPSGPRVTEAVDPAPGIEGQRLSTSPADAAHDAVARLGVRLTLVGASAAIDDARALLRGFSAGGAYGAALPADQAHAARTVLAAIIRALQPESAPVGAAAGGAVVRAVVLALGDGRAHELSRVVRRDLRALPYAQRHWLEALLRDAAELDPVASGQRRPALAPPDAPVRETGVLEAPLHEARLDGPAIPIRLGLGLLAETASDRREQLAAVATPTTNAPVTGILVAATPVSATPVSATPVSATDRVVAATQRPDATAFGARLPVAGWWFGLLLLVLAAISGFKGVAGLAALVALALAVGRTRRIRARPAHGEPGPRDNERFGID